MYIMSPEGFVLNRYGRRPSSTPFFGKFVGAVQLPRLCCHSCANLHFVFFWFNFRPAKLSKIDQKIFLGTQHFTFFFLPAVASVGGRAVWATAPSRAGKKKLKNAVLTSKRKRQGERSCPSPLNLLQSRRIAKGTNNKRNKTTEENKLFFLHNNIMKTSGGGVFFLSKGVAVCKSNKIVSYTNYSTE